MSDSDILIVGAGAKAAALAAKVHAINTLGLAEISLTIVEKTEPAASWLGRNGMTSGEEPLAIPPIKDVGFPYQSYRQFGEAGDAIDAGILPFTFQRYAVERRDYAPWVNSGSPPVRHRDYGEYLGPGVQPRPPAGAPPRLGRAPGGGAPGGDGGVRPLAGPRHRVLARRGGGSGGRRGRGPRPPAGPRPPQRQRPRPHRAGSPPRVL